MRPRPLPRRIPEEVGGWRLSAHARQRIVEMNLSLIEVERTLRFPLRVTPSSAYPGKANYERTGSGFVLAVNPEERVVITAVYPPGPGGQRWTRDGAA